MSQPEVVTELVPGSGHDEEIERLQADMTTLVTTMPEGFTEKLGKLAAEVERLKALPNTPDTIQTRETGRTIGEAFGELDHEQQRAFILARMVLIVGTIDTGWMVSAAEHSPTTVEGIWLITRGRKDSRPVRERALAAAK
jgi:hypothetical protein